MFVRGLLGLLESLVTPGFGLITARFYTRQEQPLRFNLWYCFNGVGNMVGGLLGENIVCLPLTHLTPRG